MFIGFIFSLIFISIFPMNIHGEECTDEQIINHANELIVGMFGKEWTKYYIFDHVKRNLILNPSILNQSNLGVTFKAYKSYTVWVLYSFKGPANLEKLTYEHKVKGGGIAEGMGPFFDFLLPSNSSTDFDHMVLEGGSNFVAPYDPVSFITPQEAMKVAKEKGYIVEYSSSTFRLYQSCHSILVKPQVAKTIGGKKTYDFQYISSTFGKTERENLTYGRINLDAPGYASPESNKDAVIVIDAQDSSLSGWGIPYPVWGKYGQPKYIPYKTHSDFHNFSGPYFLITLKDSAKVGDSERIFSKLPSQENVMAFVENMGGNLQNSRKATFIYFKGDETSKILIEDLCNDFSVERIEKLTPLPSLTSPDKLPFTEINGPNVQVVLKGNATNEDAQRVFLKLSSAGRVVAFENAAGSKNFNCLKIANIIFCLKMGTRPGPTDYKTYIYQDINFIQDIKKDPAIDQVQTVETLDFH